MHFQTLLYIPLSFVFANDILCYNLIRTFSFLLTGLGTFVLIWNVLRSRLAATLGGPDGDAGRADAASSRTASWSRSPSAGSRSS